MSTTVPADAETLDHHSTFDDNEVDAVLEDTASLLASLGLDQDSDSDDDGDDHDVLEDDDEQVFEVENGHGYKSLNHMNRDEARRILWSEFPLLLIFCALCTCLAFVLLLRAHNGNSRGNVDRLTIYDDTYLVDPTNDAQKVYLRKLNETLQMAATQQGKKPNEPQYCYDMDDDPDLVDVDACTCTSPWQPTPRPDPKHPNNNNRVYDQWETFHQHLVKEARKVPSQNPILDVLMLGDSLTERRMGTKNLNNAAVPDFKDVHDQYFDKSQGAPLQGIPLGAGGDTSYELLWQLEHGVLSKNLHPRAILLLIGNNDVGDRVQCSKRNALAGILNVANYLHQHRPDAKFILHALTPSTDGYRDQNYTLGYKYDKIKWINAELETYCNMNPYQWHFLDNSDVFLAKNPRSNEHHHVPSIAINSTVMWDGQNPTPLGYEIWNERLIPQIIKILEE